MLYSGPDMKDRRLWLVCKILFVAGTFAGVFWSFHGLDYPGRDGGEMVAIAQHLAAESRFADPFRAFPTGPTAHVTPLYPLFMALVSRAVGVQLFPVVLLLITSAFYGLHAALLPCVSRSLLDDVRPGLWASACVIAFPVFRFIIELGYGLHG